MTPPELLLSEARRHVEAAITALLTDGDRLEAIRHLAALRVVLDRLDYAGVRFADEGLEHADAAMTALRADGDQVEAMHQLQQLEIVLDRMAVAM